MENFKENLRKVVYQRNGDLNLYEAGFDDIQEMKKVQGLRDVRKGWFHHWLEGKNLALIENEDGIIEEIESRFIKFIEE